MRHGLPERESDSEAEQLAQEVTVTFRLAVRNQGDAQEESATYYCRTTRAEAQALIRQLEEQVQADVRALRSRHVRPGARDEHGPTVRRMADGDANARREEGEEERA